MKRPAIFFDRDNTLIACDGYLGDPAKVKLIPGAAHAVARARALGYATVVVSNQSGVARGLFDEGSVYVVNDRMDTLLRAENPQAVIDRHEFCPFHPEAVVERYRKESDLRKPKPGMILAAADKLALDLSRSWLIGDAPRDIEAGQAAGCRTVLFHDPSLPASPAASEHSIVRPDFVAASLHEALDFVAAHPSAAQGEPETVTAEVNYPAAGSSRGTNGLPVEQWPAAVRLSPPKAANHAMPAPQRVAAAMASPPPAEPQQQQPANPSRAESSPPTARLESLVEQILLEIRRRNEQGITDFSLSKLMAGIVQVLVLAVLFLGYLRGTDAVRVQTYLMVAVTLQTIAIALLIMSRPR